MFIKYLPNNMIIRIWKQNLKKNNVDFEKDSRYYMKTIQIYHIDLEIFLMKCHII